MLKVAGIKAFYVPVDHRRGVVDPDDPSLLGDHMITAIEIPADVNDKRLQAVVKARDAKRYLIFDPTDERTPVGNLGSYLQGGYGLLSAGAPHQAIALPVVSPHAHRPERYAALILAPHPTQAGSTKPLPSGAPAPPLRHSPPCTAEP